MAPEIFHSFLHSGPDVVAIQFSGRPEHHNVDLFMAALRPYLDHSTSRLVLVLEFNRISSSWFRQLLDLNQMLAAQKRELTVVAGNDRVEQMLNLLQTGEAPLLKVSANWQQAVGGDTNIIPFTAPPRDEEADQLSAFA